MKHIMMGIPCLLQKKAAAEAAASRLVWWKMTWEHGLICLRYGTNSARCKTDSPCVLLDEGAVLGTPFLHLSPLVPAEASEAQQKQPWKPREQILDQQSILQNNDAMNATYVLITFALMNSEALVLATHMQTLQPKCAAPSHMRAIYEKLR